MERKRISTGVQILYGLGVSYALVDQIFAQWVIYYYKPSAASGLKPFMTATLVSMALMFSRLVDMVTDPLVGYLSDKFDSKFGRRIPFIAVGAIPLALSTMGFFYPIKSGGIASALYLGLIGALFFSFYTIVGAPYNALIPEIGATSEERLKLSTWQSIFRLLYTAIAMLLPGIVMKKFIDSGMSSENALRGAMGILSILLIIGLVATVFGVNEKKYSTNVVKKEEKKNTKEVLKKVLSNKDFRNYLIGLMLFFAGFNTVRALMNYYIEVILGWDKGHITIVSAVLFGVAALFFIPVNIFSKKYGYRKVMLASLIFMAILMMGLIGLKYVDNLSMKRIYGLIIFGFLGVPIAGAGFIFPPAMMSDISNRVSEEVGERIEGVCFGIQGFFLKLAFLISIGVLPVLLGVGSPNEENVTETGIYILIAFSIVCVMLSYIFYYKYNEK